LLKETFVEERGELGAGTALCPWLSLRLVSAVFSGGRSKTQSVVEWKLGSPTPFPSARLAIPQKLTVRTDMTNSSMKLTVCDAYVHHNAKTIFADVPPRSILPVRRRRLNTRRAGGLQWSGF
jgi:hypothetical protein